MGKDLEEGAVPCYEDRVILFMDFLGFSEIVDETDTNTAALLNLVGAMDRLGEIGDTTFLKSQKVTQFSDSIVASYRITEPSAVFHLLNAIALCVIDLAYRGYLVRGGVTAGRLFHTTKHIVGPAMIDAYNLESTVAQVPRVVIDDQLLNIARNYRDEMHSEDDEADYVSHFMTRDRDNRYFFDYVSHRSVIEITGGEQDLYPEYLHLLGQKINEGLAHPDLRVRAKFPWLQMQYQAAIEQVEALALEHPFRIGEPEMWEAIAHLPKFAEEAKRVRDEAIAASLPVTSLY